MMNVVILTAAPIPEAMPVYTSSLIDGGLSGIIKGTRAVVAVADTVADTVAVADADGLATAVGDTVVVADAIAVADADTDTVAVNFGEEDALTEALEELLPEGLGGCALESPMLNRKARTERAR